MTAYKNQHYLPLAYLGQFGRPLDRDIRKRMVWRVSDNRGGEVSVGGQCQEDYFYSKSRASICEGYFNQIEGVYGSLMARIGRGEGLTRHDLFLFFLCAVDFYARGSKFRGGSQREEFDLYLHRTEFFKRQLISAELVNATDAVRRDYILTHWAFDLVQFPADPALLTSDSPSIWLGSSRTANELQGVLMPITPFCCFVGAHQGTYRIASSSADTTDAGVMNNNEMENCVDAVFCTEPLSEQEIALVQSRLAKRTIPQPRADAWALELIDYDLNPNLSFLGRQAREINRDAGRKEDAAQQ